MKLLININVVLFSDAVIPGTLIATTIHQTDSISRTENSNGTDLCNQSMIYTLASSNCQIGVIYVK